MASKADFYDESWFIATPEEAAYATILCRVLKFDVRGFSQTPKQLLDHLYLGNIDHATNTEMLKEVGITHILNCAALDIKTGPKFYGPDMGYLQFYAEDCDDYNIMQHFAEAYDFIEKARLKKGKVLVHCRAGINRSGALAVAYVMVYKNIGPISAAEYVRSICTQVLWNEDFQLQLIKLASEKNLLHLDAGKLADAKPAK